tara:strand:- start:785 stop:1264 length:480 start_codon:yes stop_codon:yes gene_type:complete
MGHFDEMSAVSVVAGKADLGTLKSLYPNGVEAKTAGFTAAAGTMYNVNDLDGCAIVLPAPSVGARIKFFIADVTSNTHTITSDAATTLYSGVVLSVDLENGTAGKQFAFSPDGTDDRIITLNGTTKGSSAVLEFVGESTTEWSVTGTIFGSGNIITPFS